MTNDVSEALATLQLHPDDTQALSALAALHPGNGAGIDAGGAVEGAVRRPPLSPRAGRLRAVPAAHRSGARLDDRRGPARRAVSREGAPALRRAAARRRRPGRRPAGARGRARARPVDRVGRADVAGAGELGADLAPLPRSRPRAPRIRRWPRASTARSPSSTSSTGPAGPEGEAHLRKSLELDSRQPPFERPPRAAAARRRAHGRAARALRPAGRARGQPRRQGARRGGGGRALRAGGTPGRCARPLPQGARGQPERAAGAAGGARRAHRARGLGGAGQGAGGGGADPARRAGRRAAGRARDAALEAARPAGHGGVLLPARAQARCRRTTRWSSSTASTTRPGTRPPSCSRSWRRRRRPRPTSTAAWRWGSRWRGPPSSGPSTPKRRSTSGRGSCAFGRTCRRRSRRCGGSTPPPRSGTRCSSCSRTISTRCRPRTSTKRSVATSRSSRSIAIA